jgi:uncharacterized protein YjiK
MKFKISVLISFVFFQISVGQLKPYESHHIQISEPSDICLSDKDENLFIVSDEGELYKTDKLGKIILKSKYKGNDFEGVCVKGNHVYVSDESSRKIHEFDANTLEHISSKSIILDEDLNAGFESITFNKKTNQFILISEKKPNVMIFCDENLNVINELNLKITSDISAANYYNQKLYILSDEEHCIIELDQDYKEVKRYSVNIINPEGLCFDSQGNVIIVSDNMESIFYYKKLEN